MRWLAEAASRLEQPLCAQGFAVSSSSAILVDAINLAASSSLNRWLWPYAKSYLLGLRCDLQVIAQCDWEIVPLHLDVAAKHRGVLPAWPTSQVERQSLRRSRIEHILVASPLGATAGWLDRGELQRQLAIRHLQLRTDRLDKAEFADTDILIADCAAMRATGRPYHSPLIAAWRAGVPALLVDTSIERAERQSALDYIAVASMAEAMAGIDQLRSHPQLYDSMQRQAVARARSLSEGAVTAEWLRYLRDRLVPEANLVLQTRRRHPVASMATQARRWLMQQSLRTAAR